MTCGCGFCMAQKYSAFSLEKQVTKYCSDLFVK